jgi:hypothetical protein
MNIDRFKNEYPGLSTISIIFKVIGIVIILFAVIGLIYGLLLLDGYGDERLVGVYLIISALVSGLLFSVTFFAFAELIKLLVRIEFNTRKDTVDEINKRFDNIEHQQKSVNSDKNKMSFENWKKDNPTKTLNDYYISMRKK